MADRIGNGKNWIPIRVDIHDDPAVAAIADELGMSDCEVVGRLMSIWAWATEQLENGHAQSVTSVTLVSRLDARVGCEGFCLAMERAGWLDCSKGYLEFPHWDRWMSKGAKKRLQARDRKQKQRAKEGVTKKSRKKRDISVTRSKESLSISNSLSESESKEIDRLPESVRDGFRDWLKYKVKRKEGYTDLAAQVSEVANFVAENGAELWQAGAARARAEDWKGWRSGCKAIQEGRPAKQSEENPFTEILAKMENQNHGK